MIHMNLVALNLNLILPDGGETKSPDEDKWFDEKKRAKNTRMGERQKTPGERKSKEQKRKKKNSRMRERQKTSLPCLIFTRSTTMSTFWWI